MSKKMTREQEKAMFAKNQQGKQYNKQYMVVKKSTDEKEYLYGDADNDRTPNIDDKYPYNPEKKQTVGDFSLADDFKDIEKETQARKKPMNKIEKHYQSQGYETISRTKGLHSTLNKLKRKQLINVRDLAGMTIFVKDEKDAHKVGRDIEENYEVIEKDDYYKDKRPSGYKAIHYVVMKDGKPVEIHVQTKKQFQDSQKTHSAYKRGQIDVWDEKTGKYVKPKK